MFPLAVRKLSEQSLVIGAAWRSAFAKDAADKRGRGRPEHGESAEGVGLARRCGWDSRAPCVGKSRTSQSALVSLPFGEIRLDNRPYPAQPVDGFG